MAVYEGSSTLNDELFEQKKQHLAVMRLLLRKDKAAIKDLTTLIAKTCKSRHEADLHELREKAQLFCVEAVRNMDDAAAVCSMIETQGPALPPGVCRHIIRRMLHRATWMPASWRQGDPVEELIASLTRWIGDREAMKVWGRRHVDVVAGDRIGEFLRSYARSRGTAA